MPGAPGSPPRFTPDGRATPPTGATAHAGSNTAPAAGGRRPLRPPDPPLEPQDAPVHLRGAQRHPHHRPGADREAARRRLRVVRETVARGEKVLFVGTKKQAQEPIVEEAPAPASPTSTSAGWAACSPTSPSSSADRAGSTSSARAGERRLRAADQKEANDAREELERLENTFGGMPKMKRLPGAVFIVDPQRERIAVTEASKLEIPIVGTGDTNFDPDDSTTSSRPTTTRSAQLPADRRRHRTGDHRGPAAVQRARDPGTPGSGATRPRGRACRGAGGGLPLRRRRQPQRHMRTRRGRGCRAAGRGARRPPPRPRRRRRETPDGRR